MNTSTANPWWQLTLVTVLQTIATVVTNGVAFLIPQLQQQWDLDLVAVGLLVALPQAGRVVALVPWGALIDRLGERFTLSIGAISGAICLVAAALSTTPLALGVWLFLVGVATAGTNGAGGRIVVGWFDPQRRGLAMGIRQTAQPLGIGLAALSLPLLAQHSLATALWTMAIVTGISAIPCVIFLKNPPQRPRKEDPQAENPYHGQSFLQRIHAVSALLVIPQTALWTFSLVWMISVHNLDPLWAGGIITVAQLLGALVRVLAGTVSDRLRSRVRPLRVVALAAAASMFLLATADWLDSRFAIPVLVAALVITIADNGLAFTAVAEAAGPYWSGRALGIQNTAQAATSTAVPPLLGALIGLVGYPLSFACIAIFPLLAVPLIPSAEAERKAFDRAD